MKRKLIDALKECAAAHNMKSHYYRNDDEFAIFGDNVPTYADVCMIVRAFYGTEFAVRETMGMILVEMWKDEILPKEDINFEAVAMALPYEN